MILPIPSLLLGLSGRLFGNVVCANAPRTFRLNAPISSVTNSRLLLPASRAFSSLFRNVWMEGYCGNVGGNTAPVPGADCTELYVLRNVTKSFRTFATVVPSKATLKNDGGGNVAFNPSQCKRQASTKGTTELGPV